MHFHELSSNQMRVAVDLQQTYEAYREARRNAVRYAGGLTWKAVIGRSGMQTGGGYLTRRSILHCSTTLLGNRRASSTICSLDKPRLDALRANAACLNAFEGGLACELSRDG